ncbi:MAG: hypothetical protein SVY53_02390 [Chloroflexota bacterium]|nr:hypothetical protein [Chloroflexota bacterium]
MKKTTAFVSIFVLTFTLVLFTSTASAESEISIIGGEANYESGLLSTSITATSTPLDDIFISDDDAVAEQGLSVVAITAEPLPLEQIFLSNEEASLQTALSPVVILTEPAALSDVFICLDDAQFSKGLIAPWEPTGIISCDSEGNPKDQFAPGESVYVEGSGLAEGNYKIWIQQDGVTEGDELVAGDEPMGCRTETGIVVNAGGILNRTEIWAIPVDAPVTFDQWEIIIDQQDDGDDTGRYNEASDGIDSELYAVPGFIAPVPEIPSFILFALGGMALGGYYVLRRRSSGSAHTVRSV